MKNLQRALLIMVAVVMVFSLAACGGSATPAPAATAAVTAAPAATAAATAAEPAKKTSFLIGMSQCNLGEPWRVAMNDQIAAEAKNHPELKVVYSDAAQDNSKQVADVENFIQQKVDLLIISPNEAAPLTAVVKKAFDSGIPVIVLDRKVEGDSFTQFIGGDNKLIGKKAGEWVAKAFPNGANVVEIKGLEGATPQQERHDGFMEGIKSNPGIKIIASQNADWLRDKAITVMEAMLQANKKIDCVYGHNDPMAEGAYIAAKNAKREGEMKFVGIDALPTPDGGIKSVIDGRINVTHVYPTGGKEAILSAVSLLEKGAKLDKTITLDTIQITKDNAAAVFAQFGGK
jgi:ribose transport system substrate-binding protein